MTKIGLFCPKCKQYQEPEELSFIPKYMDMKAGILGVCSVCGLHIEIDFTN